MKMQPSRGSHLPLLMRVVGFTGGPIVELGCGIYSTEFLHWACYSAKRKLVTIEGNPRYFDYAKQFEADFHEVLCIDDWDAVDLSAPWSVAFVDHAETKKERPEGSRAKEVARLTHAEYVVVHDTENRNDRKYRFSSIHHLYKHRYKYNAAYPHTSVFSNSFDVGTFDWNWEQK